MNNLRLWAKYYYDMGFNVTHINPDKNRGKAKNIYKSPTNDRHKIANTRQSLEEMQNFDYENSTGIGTVLGFNNLRALDFDGLEFNHGYKITEEAFKNFIKKCLKLLNLPLSYEWVVRTPNFGFHIIIYAPEHTFSIEEDKTKAFTPNINTYSKDAVYPKHIELRWNKHLVLPPSININNNMYTFYFCDIPRDMPKKINNNNLKDLLDELCFDEYENNDNLFGCYNAYYGWLFEASYEEKVNNCYPEYAEFEFLDFSRVEFKKEKFSNHIQEGFINMTVLDEREEGSIYKKEKVLVVSRTKMGYSNVCIGSISEEGKYMRLLLPNDQKMRSSIDININDYLTIEYQDVKQIVAPHYEDISIYYANDSKKFLH